MLLWNKNNFIYHYIVITDNIATTHRTQITICWLLPITTGYDFYLLLQRPDMTLSPELLTYCFDFEMVFFHLRFLRHCWFRPVLVSVCSTLWCSFDHIDSYTPSNTKHPEHVQNFRIRYGFSIRTPSGHIKPLYIVLVEMIVLLILIKKSLKIPKR